jgi:predicted phage terminase large subunit-like protein
MIELAAKWKPTAVLVEDKASGQSLIQDLQQNTRLPVRPVAVDGDKLMRAHTVVPSWEAGRVFALDGAPFLPELLSELYAFPKSPHDDQTDALVQGARYIITHGGSSGFLRFAAQELARMNAERKVAESSSA